MNSRNNTILEKMSELEKELQFLKLRVFLDLPKKQKEKYKVYKERNIINEIKKIRKKLWDEKYSKTV